MSSDASYVKVSFNYAGKSYEIIHESHFMEEKGEPKRGVEPTSFPLTSRGGPYHQAKPAHTGPRTVAVVVFIT